MLCSVDFDEDGFINHWENAITPSSQSAQYLTQLAAARPKDQAWGRFVASEFDGNVDVQQMPAPRLITPDVSAMAITQHCIALLGGYDGPWSGRLELAEP